METLIEFFKSIFSNSDTVKVTLMVTIFLSIAWFVYQTIADTNNSKSSNKYANSHIGQLITGNAPNDKLRQSNNDKTSNNDIDMDVRIIRALRRHEYLSEEEEKRKTSRGYNAIETYEDLRRIISYSNEIRDFVKRAGSLQTQRISSFSVEVVEDEVEIKSITLPPIKMTVQEALSISDIDSLKGIIDDNRILSAFAFDPHPL